MMKKICVAFTLLLLLFIPFVASADGNLKIIPADNSKVQDPALNEEYQQKLQEQQNESVDNESEDVKAEEVQEESNKEKNEDDENGILKSLRATFKGALDDFTYGILDQMMEGSVTVFEADAETDESGSTDSISYTINTKIVKPFEPQYVKTTLTVTGIFYLCVIGFTMLGSYLMLLWQEIRPEGFSKFREEIFGEEKPYSTSTVHTACSIALAYPIIALILIVVITGTRNLTVFAVSPHGVVIPDLYADSIPTFFLTSFSSWMSAIESAFGEYGIYTFCALTFVIGGFTDLLLVFGAIGKALILNVVFWGLYGLWNFIDIINVCTVSAGVYSYVYTGKTIMVTVGVLAGFLSGIIILAIIVIFAVWRGRKIVSGGY